MSRTEHEARFWTKETDGRVRCTLCPHNCVIEPGKKGICGVRQNLSGRLVSNAYGRVTSLALDPVEKKPLFHVDPGSLFLSVGSFGCNFKCEFCQNWPISQGRPETRTYSAEEIAKAAMEQRKLHKNMAGVAYTYNEPTVWLEFVLDVASIIKDAGMKNVLITNGFISQEALGQVLRYADAFNIDIKAWDDRFYSKMAHGRLEPVLRTVEKCVEKDKWVEVTYLVIPGKNDDTHSVECLAKWLHALSPSIPLHLSRYFPAYRSNEPITPFSTLETLKAAARQFLNFVYIGNAWKRGYADTLCPRCEEVLIQRGGMEIEASYLQDGSCPNCRRPLELLGKMWI